MTKIKNIAGGPRGFHSVGGEVLLETGQEWEGEIDHGEIVSASRTGSFEIDGSRDPLDHDGDGKKGGAAAPAGQAASADEIKAALAQLDGTNDDQWTAAGLPQVDAVNALLGGKVATRKAIEEAAPDFKRPTT